MLLAIDAGNTNTVFGLFKDNKLQGQWRIVTDAKRTTDEYAVYLKQLFGLSDIGMNEINAVIISSVVPQNIYALKELCKNYFKCDALVIGDDKVNLGIKVKLPKPSEVGADRLVNTVAAFNKYGGNVIVIDFGTATTFDVVDAVGDYLGGVIAPGINLSIDALHKAAAKLPEINIVKPSYVIGNSTETAMQSGIYFGYIGLIEKITASIKQEYNERMLVVATGGLASLFYEATELIDRLDANLTIDGLNIIYRNNSN